MRETDSYNPTLEELKNTLKLESRKFKRHKKKVHDGELGVHCHDCNGSQQKIGDLEYLIRITPATS